MCLKKKRVQALVVWSQLHQRDTKVKPNGERRRSMVMIGRLSLVGWRERCCASSRMRQKAQATCDKKRKPHTTKSASHMRQKVHPACDKKRKPQRSCSLLFKEKSRNTNNVLHSTSSSKGHDGLNTWCMSAPDKLGPNNRGTILKLASPRPKTTLRHLARAQHW